MCIYYLLQICDFTSFLLSARQFCFISECVHQMTIAARKIKMQRINLVDPIVRETFNQNPLLSWPSAPPSPAWQIQEHDSLRADDHRRPERGIPRDKAGQREISLLATQTHCWSVNVPLTNSISCFLHWGKNLYSMCKKNKKKFCFIHSSFYKMTVWMEEKHDVFLLFLLS